MHACINLLFYATLTYASLTRVVNATSSTGSSPSIGCDIIYWGLPIDCRYDTCRSTSINIYLSTSITNQLLVYLSHYQHLSTSLIIYHQSATSLPESLSTSINIYLTTSITNQPLVSVSTSINIDQHLSIYHQSATSLSTSINIYQHPSPIIY